MLNFGEAQTLAGPAALALEGERMGVDFLEAGLVAGIRSEERLAVLRAPEKKDVDISEFVGCVVVVHRERIRVRRRRLNTSSR